MVLVKGMSMDMGMAIMLELLEWTSLDVDRWVGMAYNTYKRDISGHMFSMWDDETVRNHATTDTNGTVTRMSTFC